MPFLDLLQLSITRANSVPARIRLLVVSPRSLLELLHKVENPVPVILVLKQLSLALLATTRSRCLLVHLQVLLKEEEVLFVVVLLDALGALRSPITASTAAWLSSALGCLAPQIVDRIVARRHGGSACSVQTGFGVLARAHSIAGKLTAGVVGLLAQFVVYLNCLNSFES